MAMNSNLSYFMERVQGVSSNIFRLEPQNSSRATPNSQIRFNLPSNCLLNFRSLRFMANATTEDSAADGGARLPPKIDSLITRYEILAGGVQISQGFDLYNVFVQAKAVLMGSTCDATLGHPEMVRQKSYVDSTEIATTANEVYPSTNGATQFGIQHFEGFLGSCEPGVLDTSLMPDLTLIFYVAGREVLSSVAGVTLKGTPASTTDITNDGTGNVNFSLNNIRLNLEVIGLASAVYDELLSRRIADVGFVEIPFKSYQSFIDSHTGATKFSISCQSLDRIWVVQRKAGYDTIGGAVVIEGYKKAGCFTAPDVPTNLNQITQDIGVPQYELGGVLRTNGEKMTTKYFNMTLNQGAAPATFQMQLNGSFLPQVQMNAEEMYALSMNACDRSYNPMLTLDQYRKNYFVQCYRTCLPGGSTRSLSGLDTRGINLTASYNTTNVTPNSNVVVFCEMTSSLRVGNSRQIEVIL